MPVAQENENLPATPRQTYAIFRLGGGDVRKDELTRKMASELIEKLTAMRAAQGGSIKTDAPKKSEEDFDALVQRAVEAANEAGDQWMACAQPAYAVMDGNRMVGTMLDVCAIVYIRVTDKRTRFAKWLAKKDNQRNILKHKYSFRQEMGLLEASYGAMLKVLEDGGVTGLSLYSRID